MNCQAPSKEYTHIVSVYGRNEAMAMAQAASEGKPILIRHNGNLVESKLFNKIRKTITDPILAWKTYINTLYYYSTDTRSEVDEFYEPLDYNVPTKEKRSSIESPTDILRKPSSQSEIADKRIMEMITALDKNISASLSKGGNVKTARLYNLLESLKDEASTKALLEFMLYSMKYIYYLKNKLATDYSNLSDIGEGYEADSLRAAEFLRITEGINDVFGLYLTDRTTSRIIDRYGIDTLLKGLVASRTEIATRLEVLDKEYIAKKIAEAAPRMREQFIEDKQKEFAKFKPVSFWKGATEDWKKARDKYVEEQLELNKTTIANEEIGYARRIVNARTAPIGSLSSWIIAGHGLNDEVIQYAHQRIADTNFENRELTDGKVRQIAEVYQDFDTATKARTTQQEKYEEMLEDRLKVDKNGFVEYDSNGNPIVEKAKVKKSRWMVGAYYNQWQEERSRRENLVSEAKTNGNMEQSEALEKELEDWYSKNATWDSETNTPVPNEKWANPQYKKLLTLEKSNPAIFKMYTTLVETMSEADDMLPARSLGMGLKVPQVEKDFYEKQSTEGLLSGIKLAWQQTWSVRKDEDIYGDIGESMGKVHQALLHRGSANIPLYYRRDVDLDNLSYDLATGVALAYDNAANFMLKAEVQGELEMLKRVAGDRKVFTGKGVVGPYRIGDEFDPNIETFYKDDKRYSRRFSGSEAKEGTASDEYKALASLLDDQLYGRSSATSASIDKLTRNLMVYTGNQMLGLNWPSGARNLVMGHLQNWIMASSNGLITNKDWVIGLILAGGKSGVWVVEAGQDFGKVKPKSLTGLLAEKFNAYSSWSVVDRKFANGAAFKQLIKGSALNIFNGAAEHTVQSALMYSVLNTIEVDSTKGKIKLHEAYEIGKDGRLKVKDGVTMPENLEKLVSRKIADFKRRAQGNYDSETRAMAQRYAAGKLLFMFRKWMPDGIKRRYRGITSWDTFWNAHTTKASERYFNMNTGKFEEGAYLTTWRLIRGFADDFMRFQFDTSRYVYAKRSELTDQDIANIHSTVKELALVALTALLAAGLKRAYDDEDDKIRKRRLAWWAYFAGSINSELSFFVNPDDTLKLTRNPSAVIKTLENIQGAFYAAMPWAWGAEYEGGRLAGQSKLNYKISQLLPGVRMRDFDPEFANQFIFKSRF